MKEQTVYGAGALIKAKRLDEKLSLRSFAEKYDISYAVLSQLENDKIKNPSMKTLSALAKALDLPISSICSLYSIVSREEDKEKEKNELTPEQKLKLALRQYGVCDDRINETLDYINYIISRQGNFSRQQFFK